MVSGAVRQVWKICLRPRHVERGAEVIGALPVLAGRDGWFVVDSHMSVKIGLVAGAVLTNMAHKWLLSSVDLLVTIQQCFSHKALSTSRPLAGIS